ncbi:DUF3500 domain-containing protein [Labedaea rhizosphaerae]|uniref:DUF3500 domain-containing protein n=1 Tax=Labedaea rhizosphaerae TaxID=598644 RepID=UPI001AADB083|nr:DUF3500 domain-containing protein [Labedaea rhizosphaerae]
MRELGRIRALAAELAAAATEDQLRSLKGRCDDPTLREWTYLPGDRPGLSFEHMTAEQRELAHELIAATHSEAGAELARGVIEVERMRRQLATGTQDVGPDKYWFRVYGDPAFDDPGGAAPWGWRVNGHHLAVHAIVVGDRLTVTPHFIGAEPAEVNGRRILGPDEDAARALLTALDEDQRRAAVFAAEPPDDILTRDDPAADPSVLPAGLRRTDMTAPQQEMLDALTRRYLDRAPKPYADAVWAELDRDLLRFAWAGGTERGDRHYYCVAGGDVLIEYDNQQDDGNHAHSVWRHLRDDWGGDLLRAHYAKGHNADTTA